MPLGVIDGPGPKEEGKMREREVQREKKGVTPCRMVERAQLRSSLAGHVALEMPLDWQWAQ